MWGGFDGSDFLKNETKKKKMKKKYRILILFRYLPYYTPEAHSAGDRYARLNKKL